MCNGAKYTGKRGAMNKTGKKQRRELQANRLEVGKHKDKPEVSKYALKIARRVEELAKG